MVQGQSAEKVAAEIAAHVAAKGFCTVDPRLDDDLLRSGREVLLEPLKHLKSMRKSSKIADVHFNLGKGGTKIGHLGRSAPLRAQICRTSARRTRKGS